METDVGFDIDGPDDEADHYSSFDEGRQHEDAVGSCAEDDVEMEEGRPSLQSRPSLIISAQQTDEDPQELLRDLLDLPNVPEGERTPTRMLRRLIAEHHQQKGQQQQQQQQYFHEDMSSQDSRHHSHSSNSSNQRL